MKNISYLWKQLYDINGLVCSQNAQCLSISLWNIIFFLLLHNPRDPRFEGGFFLVCAINNEHNHPVHCADSMRHRAVSDETREEFTGLLESGHSPSTVLDVLKFKLQDKHGDDYLFLEADGSMCPHLDKHRESRFDVILNCFFFGCTHW